MQNVKHKARVTQIKTIHTASCNNCQPTTDDQKQQSSPQTQSSRQIITLIMIKRNNFIICCLARIVRCRTSAAVSSFVCGILFGVLWFNYQLAVMDSRYPMYTPAPVDLDSLPETDYDQWLRSKGLRSVPLPEEDVSFGDTSKLRIEADFLKQEVPVLCLIISKGRNKAKSVKDTWAKHCNQVVFIGAYTDNVIPVIRYSSIESSHTSFCRIVIDIYHKYFDKFKWLLIAEDSSYVLVENARKYVAPLNHTLPYYLGRTVQKYSTPPFNAPDSTMLLSAGAFQLLNEQFFVDYEACTEAALLNRTLAMSRNFEVSLGVMFNHEPEEENSTSEVKVLTSKPMDTRDKDGKARFLAFTPEKHLIPGLISIFNSYWRGNTFPIAEGPGCCSDQAISFHGLSPTQMYLIEYLLYHLKVFKNSPRGIGNEEPKYSRSAISDLIYVHGLEVGTPMIKMIDKEKIKKSKMKGSLSKLLAEVFGDS